MGYIVVFRYHVMKSHYLRVKSGGDFFMLDHPLGKEASYSMFVVTCEPVEFKTIFQIALESQIRVNAPTPVATLISAQNADGLKLYSTPPADVSRRTLSPPAVAPPPLINPGPPAARGSAHHIQKTTVSVDTV